LNTLAYMQGWVGVYGYSYWPVPALTYVLYPLAVFAGLSARDGVPLPDKRTRLLFAALFVRLLPSSPVRGLHASLLVAGAGRYFTVIMRVFLFFTRPSTSVQRRTEVTVRPPASLGCSPPLLWFTRLTLSYHVPCGSEYRWSLCHQPQYKTGAGSVSSPPASASPKLTGDRACMQRHAELSVWLTRTAWIRPAAGAVLCAPTQKDVIGRRSERPLPESGWLTVSFP
jgi:hypothetical protein